MLGAVFDLLERNRQVEDGFPMLNGHYPSRGKRSTIANAVDIVKNRHRWITRAQEVGVQRVNLKLLDGASRRHQGLASHLPAKHPHFAIGWAEAAKHVDFDGLKVEQVDDIVEFFGHRHSLADQAETPHDRHRNKRPTHAVLHPCA